MKHLLCIDAANSIIYKYKLNEWVNNIFFLIEHAVFGSLHIAT